MVTPPVLTHASDLHAPVLYACHVGVVALAVTVASGADPQTGPVALAALAGLGAAALARDVWAAPAILPSALRAISCTGAALICLAFLAGLSVDSDSLRLTASVFAVALICDLAAGLMGGRRRHALAVFAAVVALSFVPIWAGHLLVGAPRVQDALLGINPLTQILVQVEVDPFRTGLFYGRSQIGDLRYGLPYRDTALIAQFFLVALLSGALASRRRGRT